MTHPSAPEPLSGRSDEPAALLDHLLESLFDDFGFWFARGLVLLEHTPDRLLPGDERRRLRGDLQDRLTAGSKRGTMALAVLNGACRTRPVVSRWTSTVHHGGNLFSGAPGAAASRTNYKIDRGDPSPRPLTLLRTPRARHGGDEIS